MKKNNGGNRFVVTALKKINVNRNKKVVHPNKKITNQKILAVVHHKQEDENKNENDEDGAKVSFSLKVGKYKKFKYM